MHISISSGSEFLWYKYQGKKVSFSEHHAEYDLEILTNDIIGIKGNTLVHKDEQKVKFKMTALEISKLLNTSVHLDYDHKVYPKLALPCNKAEVKRLYAYFNQKLFAGECPSNVVFVQSRSAKTLGKAYFKGLGVPMKLQYSEGAMTSVPLFCDMIVHEMIHLLHFKRAYIDGDRQYANQGHQTLFKKDMLRINSLGFHVRITGSDYEAATLQDPVHVAVFKDGDNQFAFWGRKPIDTDAIVLFLQRYYRVQPSSFLVGTSTDDKAMGVNKLSVSGSPIRGRRLRISKLDFTKLLLDAERHEIAAPNGVTPSVKAAVDLAASSLDVTHDEYLGAVLSRLYNTPKYTSEYTSLIPSEADRAYVEKVFAGITDKDILTGKLFHLTKRRLLVQDLDGNKALHYLAGMYKLFFVGRVTPARYAELCATYFDIITLPHAYIVRYLTKELS